MRKCTVIKMENNDAKSLNLKDLWTVFVQHWITLLLVGILTVGGAYAYQKLTYVPKYASTATLYISSQETTGQTKYNDYMMSLSIVEDCTALMTNRMVLEDVLESLDLDPSSYQTLRRNILINNPTDTRILEVTVLSESPEKSQSLVSTLARIGVQEITNVMGSSQIKVYKPLTVDIEPYNRIGIQSILLPAVVVDVLLYVVLFLAFYFDDRVHDDEDIERELGLKVFGGIPDSSSKTRRGEQRYARRSKYMKNRYGYGGRDDVTGGRSEAK